jgi:hypothetical protein
MFHNIRLANGRFCGGLNWSAQHSNLLTKMECVHEAAMSEKQLGHCIGFGAFISPGNAFVVYDPMSRIGET